MSLIPITEKPVADQLDGSEDFIVIQGGRVKRSPLAFDPRANYVADSLAWAMQQWDFNAAWFDVGGSGSATAQGAINFANLSGGGRVFFPVKVYNCTEQINLLPNVSILGEQKGAFGAPGVPGVCFSKEFTAAGDVFYSPNTQTIASVTFERFYIKGNKDGLGGTTGNGFQIQLCNDIKFRDVWCDELPANGFANGQGAGSFHVYYYNCYSFFCGAAGFLNQHDWARYVDCWADGCNIGIDFPNNPMCGSNAHIERCHFEESTYAAIAVRGDPAMGGNGDSRIVDCVIYCRPYNAGDASHGIVLDSTSAPAGCTGNQIRGNKIMYQATYGPSKVGKRGIMFTGGQGQSNVVDGNAITGFDVGIDIQAGSVRNTVSENYPDACNTGINVAAVQTTLDGNVYTNNVNDLTPTGAALIASNERYTVAPTFPADAQTSNNTLGSRGDWTPHLLFGGASAGISYGSQKGRFEKTGRVVHAWINVTLTAKGTSTGTAEFDLPVTPTQLQSPALVYVSAGGSGITDTVFGYVNPSSGRFTLAQGAGTLLTDANFSNTTSLIAHLTYEA